MVALLAGPQKKLCVLAVHKVDLATQSTVTDITPANAPLYTNKPVLADLSIDTDHCPSLIDVDGGLGGLRKYDGVLLGGHCTLKAAAAGGDPVAAMPVASGSAKIIGRAPMLPALAGESSDIVVTSDGLYLLKSGGRLGRDLRGGAAVVARRRSRISTRTARSTSCSSGEGADDLDILYHKTFALLFPVFQLLRLDTAAEVTSIVIDDYDGNGWPDIAFTEKLANHTELDVAYGHVRSATGSDPGRRVLELDRVREDRTSGLRRSARRGRRPRRADARRSVRGPDVLARQRAAHDVAVLRSAHERRAEQLRDEHDLSQHRDRLVRPDDRRRRRPSRPRRHRGAESRDVAAGSDARAWIASGNGSTLDGTSSDGAKLDGLAACGLGTANTGCVEEALFFPWPSRRPRRRVQPRSLEVAGRAACSIRARHSTTITAAKATGFAADSRPTRPPQSLHAADLDGDGALELIATFESDTAERRRARVRGRWRWAQPTRLHRCRPPRSSAVRRRRRLLRRRARSLHRARSAFTTGAAPARPDRRCATTPARRCIA